MSNAVKSEVARLIAAEREASVPGGDATDRVWERLQGRLDGSVPDGPEWLERGGAIGRWRRRGLSLLLLAGVAAGGAAVWGQGRGDEPRADALESVEVAGSELPVQGAKPHVAAMPAAPEEEHAEVPGSPVVDDSGQPGTRPAPRKTAAAISPSATRSTERAASGKTTEPATDADAPKSTLDAELAAIENARSALKRGKYATAQRDMEAHSKRFPGGLLGEEAAALATAAKCARTDDPTQNAVARAAYDAAWPGSIHARIVRRHCQAELDELLK